MSPKQGQPWKGVSTTNHRQAAVHKLVPRNAAVKRPRAAFHRSHNKTSPCSKEIRKLHWCHVWVEINSHTTTLSLTEKNPSVKYVDLTLV